MLFTCSVESDSLLTWTAARQAPLSFTLSLGVCSNSCPLSQWCHPTISSCHPLLLLPSIFPSIRVSSNESALTSGGQSICNITSVLSPSLSLTLLGRSPRWSPSPPCVSGGQSLAGIRFCAAAGRPQASGKTPMPCLPLSTQDYWSGSISRAKLSWTESSDSCEFLTPCHFESEYQLNSHKSVLQGRRELDGGHLAFSFNYFAKLDTLEN